MRTDVHAAALRAAAKLVFGMTSVTTLTAACAAHAGTSAQAVTASNDGAGAKVDCDDTLKTAFPGEDRYQSEPVKQTSEVVACCNKELANQAVRSGYHWNCCAAYDKLDPDGSPETVSRQQKGAACSPWGPPVPPKMNRARSFSQRVA